MHTRAVEVTEANLGPDHPRTRGVRSSVVLLLDALGRSREARTVGERILASPGIERDPSHADIANDLGRALLHDRAYDAALDAHRRALASDVASARLDRIDSVRAHLGIAEVHLARQQPGEAAEAASKAIALLDGTRKPRERERAHALALLGRAALADRRPREARDLLARAHALAAVHDHEPGRRADIGFALARATAAAGGDHAEAVRLARDARAVYAAEPWFAPRLAEVDAWLGSSR
jgi:tetratricopeptide (TPR) repeat protein